MSIISERVRHDKIIAILRKIPEEKLEFVIDALYKGGIRMLEITFDQKSKDCYQQTGAEIRLAKAMFNDLMVGAGTVMSVEDVHVAHEAGAEFVLTPNVDEQVIQETCRLQMPVIPGAMTPSEVLTAYRYGAEIVKLFPAGNLGISFSKSLMAPINHIPLIAVGGIELKNLRSFLDAGFWGVGIGTSLTDKKLIANNDWQALKQLTARYVEEVR